MPDDLDAKVAVLEERSQRIERKVDKACLILHGNGKPAEGIIFQVTAIHRLLKWLIGLMSTTLAAVIIRVAIDFL